MGVLTCGPACGLDGGIDRFLWLGIRAPKDLRKTGLKSSGVRQHGLRASWSTACAPRHTHAHHACRSTSPSPLASPTPVVVCAHDDVARGTHRPSWSLSGSRRRQCRARSTAVRRRCSRSASTSSTRQCPSRLPTDWCVEAHASHHRVTCTLSRRPGSCSRLPCDRPCSCSRYGLVVAMVVPRVLGESGCPRGEARGQPDGHLQARAGAQRAASGRRQRHADRVVHDWHGPRE